MSKFLTFSRVHSVRYRIKNPEHLIEKIIRKRIENNERIIDFKNYKDEITDLIGVRVLHLFKSEYSLINRNIRENFQIAAAHTPIIYKRNGDVVRQRKSLDTFEIKDHPRGYRSIHYILESTPTINTYYIEVQVRTIFEEGWSEIDHKLLYPDNLKDSLLNEFSMILNSLSGSADSMATQMKILKLELESMNEEHELEIKKRDEQIKSLGGLIQKSNLRSDDKEEIIKVIESSGQYGSYRSIFKKYLKSTSNDLFVNSIGSEIQKNDSEQ